MAPCGVSPGGSRGQSRISCREFLPLFQGSARPSVLMAVSMNDPFSVGKELHVDPDRRALHDPQEPFGFEKRTAASFIDTVGVRGIMTR